jgi:hypothetical protein
MARVLQRARHTINFRWIRPKVLFHPHYCHSLPPLPFITFGKFYDLWQLLTQVNEKYVRQAIISDK